MNGKIKYVCLFIVVQAALAVADGLFVDDPCNITVLTSGRQHFIDEFIPDSCTNGTFRWNYPRHSVHLHFPNPYAHQMAACISNNILGKIFTIRDITDVVGMPMVVGDKESCTKKYEYEIVLRIDAPDVLYYFAAINYEIRVDSF